MSSRPAVRPIIFWHCYSTWPTLPSRYSPNLSRRCTHLAVPGGAQAAAGAGGGGSSEKLRIAWRNRHKWGLEIVDLR